MKLSADHLLDLAWFDSGHAFLANCVIGDEGKIESAEQLRPLSLGSMLALEVMGLTVLDPQHTLTSEQEMEQIALYKWLHLDDLDRVKRLVFSGAWRSVAGGTDPGTPGLNESGYSEALIAAFRAFRDHTLATIAAASITIAPKPDRSKGTDRPPSSVVSPSLFTWRVEFLADKTRLEREYIRWQLPMAQALQIIHHHLWFDGSWTVRPSSAAAPEKPDAFEQFDLFALEAPPTTPEQGA